MDRPFSTDVIAGCLERVHARFRARGIWHALIYGTLLGAVREGDLIPWDYDFDLLVRPDQVDEILELNAEFARDKIVFERTFRDGEELAINPGGLASFHTSALAIWFDGEKIGDLYIFSLFRDGILRRYDAASGAYWCPHSSFPHHFVEMLGTATIRGRSYPIPRDAEKLLEGIYGADWRVPYRAAMQGGELREGATTHGDRYAPKLREEIAWCESRGWDRKIYASERPWPQPIRGAGPLGPTERTEDNSRSLWWKSVGELLEFF